MAKTFRELAAIDVVIGFNASSRVEWNASELYTLLFSWRLWSDKKTARDILSRSRDQLPPVRLETAAQQRSNLEDALISDLVAIGIIEVRPNNKINIPDIFRLDAGIKRKGGVSAPQRAQRE